MSQNTISATQAATIADRIAYYAKWNPRGELLIVIQESALDENSRQFINKVWSCRRAAKDFKDISSKTFEGMARAERLMKESKLHIYVYGKHGERKVDYFVD